MSRLKVLLRGALISEVQLNQEVEYIGGRKEGSDIRLQAEKGISREHFRLKFQEGQWQVSAVSRFGDIFSMGQKVDSANLDHGQSFQIPPYEFQLLDVPESDSPSTQQQPVQEIGENERTVIGAVPQVPYVKMVNSAGEVREMLRLEVGDLWVAGRDPSCQIIIPDQRVSRRQFEVHKMNGVYTILDLASVNGTFLNGSPVSSTDPQTLKSGDVISVLDNSMYFELHDPNFKYKVDRIQVAPIHLEQVEEQYVDDNLVENNNYPAEVPEISQDNNYEQMQQGQGPFTGMPPNGEDPNQFYSFQPAAPEVVLTPWKKFVNNKPLVAIAVLLFLAAMYGLSEIISPSTQVAATAEVDPADPLAKLTPQQRKEVEENYTLAEQMMTQQKYDLAMEKISKIYSVLPAGYKDSEKIRDEADQSLRIIAQALADNERKEQESANAEKIETVTAQCKKLLTPDITTEKMTECLGPILTIDATHPKVVQLSAEAERISNDRRAKEIEEQSYKTRVVELKTLYDKAEKTQAAGYAFKAMKLYKEVENSKLPDPNKVKPKAKQRIAFIEKKVSDKSQKGIVDAETLFQEGRLKQAITILRESLIYDPENQKIKDRIEANTLELRQRMQIIYQEAIIDESYGMVDSTEARQGAKDKWKKIVELDSDDGEYYKKAVIKLRRYGAM